MSVLKISFFVLSAVVATAWCYAGGAPEAACVDMVPQHAVDPQKSPFPYTVTADKAKISVADKVKISIAGKKPFKGFLLQVRDGKEAVGSFNIPADDKVARTSDCFSRKQVLADLLQRAIVFSLKQVVILINNLGVGLAPHDFDHDYRREYEIMQRRTRTRSRSRRSPSSGYLHVTAREPTLYMPRLLRTAVYSG